MHTTLGAEVADILNHLSALAGLLPTGAAILRYRSYDWALRLLARFFWIASLFDLVLVILKSLGFANNMPLFYAFSVVNLLFFSTLYYHALRGSALRQEIWPAACLILAFTVYDAWQPGQIWKFPSLVMTAQSLLFILLSLLYFYQLLFQPVVVAIEKEPLFWVSAGVLVYFSGNLFLFMMQQWISQASQVPHHNYWIIHSTANILANFLYATGLLCNPQRPT